MFKSEFSGKIYGPKVKETKVVIKTRPKKYVNEVKGELVESRGWEIVKELIIGPDELDKVKEKYGLGE